MPSSPSFLIFRSSAGSGKTFALAREYLTIALSGEGNFRSVLGVTFTNKATEEMKRRILEVLKDISEDRDHPMGAQLQKSLGVDKPTLKKRASALLSSILHQYSRFAVVTIDSFFHQVIRSFARETGLQGSFSITLDNEDVMQKVIDNLLADLGNPDRKQLRKWLTRFAESNIEEGKPWDFQKDIGALAKEILEDDFKEYAAHIANLNQDPQFFEDFLNELQESKKTFENATLRMALEGAEAIESCGGLDVFKGKTRGPAALFKKISTGDFGISDPRRRAVDNTEAWLTKQMQANSALLNTLETKIFPGYKAIIEYIDERLPMYASVVEVQRYFFTFGILSAIGEMLQRYRDEQDTMLISDLPDFLRQIINDSETPYIYEKVGSAFHHFLIDEFQDTSGFQWQNFRSLVKNGTDQGYRSMVVGDVKQSIYRWRGGDWKLLDHNVKDHFSTEMIREETLDENWRSSRTIVDFNNHFFEAVLPVTQRFFSDMPEQYGSMLDLSIGAYRDVVQQAKSSVQGGVVALEFIPRGDESWKEISIRKTIKLTEELQRRGYHLRDIAILTRSKNEGKLLSDAFFAYKNTPQADPALGYEVISAEALYLYSSHVVKMIIGLLKWLYHEDDQIALTEWLYEYQRYIAGQDQRTDTTIFQSRESWEKQVPILFVESRSRIKTLPVYELIEELIRVFRLNEVREEFTYLQAFQDAVLDFTKNESGDISQFLDWWEQIRKERAILVADDNDAIKILTIHKAKGLEFPVVIAPFLGWNLDHDTYGREEIMWCPPPTHPPLNQLPVIPLRYTQSLKNTIWAGQYWQEKVSAFIDNLNLLYVTFTRPVRELYAFGEFPEMDRLRNAGDLVLSLVKQMEDWNDETLRFDTGDRVDPPVAAGATMEYGLDHYPSHSWRSAISLQMKASGELSERVFSAQKWGIEFHQMLGKLERLDDLPALADDDLKRSLQMIVHHEDVEPFFRDVEEVKIEAPVLLPDGKFYRIDRLIKKSGTWYVIDFKTGSPRPKDRDQVRNYIGVLNEMGYDRCQGRLIYLDPVMVEEVH